MWLTIYILLHRAGVGPVHETDNPNQFMQYMENLMALGGGDEPEMCLTAIQVNKKKKKKLPVK